MISRGSASTWKRTATAVMALGLVAGACSSSSGDDSSDTTDETIEGADTDVGGDDASTSEPAETEPTDTDAADDTGDTVEVVQTEGGLLAAVQDAGVVKCGANEALPGFGVVDSAGEYAGFDIDFCKVVAAGILGDAEAVEYVSLNADARFPALQSGEVDVLIRNTTWTASRDGDQGGNFLFTTFYDGQGVMVPEDSGITDLEGLADASICVLSGTTTELNLSSVFTARGINYNPVVFDDNTTLRPAYEEGQCEAWTADASALASNKAAIEDEGGAAQFIIPEVISKEPLGPVVVDGDTEWAQAVNWAVMAPVQAWEFGLDSSNIGSYDGDDPNILTFLGQGDDVAATLGLPADYAVQAVEQVGNYQEIYDAHITPIGLSLEGSPNNLWTEGGLMYVPPFR
ncbi:amino acid ABC transporter substrate-binding protein [Ilumatobacter sp.]|uniref:amino acid ABC transporter substrate-binding protein n=1 Tax=Ilumatobacter sp. TaxID=1967498 RepID=UPI003C31310C